MALQFHLESCVIPGPSLKMFRSEDNESRWTLAPLGMRFRDYSHLENMWVACEFLNTISGNDDIVKKCTYPILWQGLMRSAEYKYHTTTSTPSLTSPPEIMMSLLLSIICMTPSGCITARSPELKYPPLNALWVAFESLKYCHRAMSCKDLLRDECHLPPLS